MLAASTADLLEFGRNRWRRCSHDCGNILFRRGHHFNLAGDEERNEQDDDYVHADSERG